MLMLKHMKVQVLEICYIEYKLRFIWVYMVKIDLGNYVTKEYFDCGFITTAGYKSGFFFSYQIPTGRS